MSSNRLTAFVVCTLVISSISGCDFAWKVLGRLTESGEQRYRRVSRENERARERAKAEAKYARDLAQFLKTKECIDCVLNEVDFSGKSFQSSNLQKSHVHFASAVGADFRNSDLEEAVFKGRTDGMDLRGSNVKAFAFSSTATLKGIRLDELDLRKVRFADSINWSGAILRGAKLDRVFFFGPRGRYNHFKTSKSVMNVGLGGTYAIGTDFSGASMVETNIGLSNLESAKFVGTNLFDAILSGSNLKNADLMNSNLDEASFLTTNATNANFHNVSAKEAEFNEANLTNANFKGADLRRANFKEAVITNTNFEDANLTGAIWVDGRRCKKGSIGECKL